MICLETVYILVIFALSDVFAFHLIKIPRFYAS